MDISTSLIEQQVLSCLYQNIDLLETEYNKNFVSDIGSAIFKGLAVLQEKELTPNIRGVLLHGVKHYPKLKADHLQFLKDEQVSNLKDFEIYVTELKKARILEDLREAKLEDFTIEVNKKQVDLDVLENRLEGMLESVSEAKQGKENDEVEFLSRHDEALKFKEIIEKRKAGVIYPSGDSYLDDYLYNNSLMPQEITTVFANSGSGKSSFVRCLTERRILKNLPTLDIQLEMGLEATLDAKMGIRGNIERSNFSFGGKENSEEEFLDMKYERVEKLIDKELKKAKRYNMYYQLNLDSLSLKELKRLILKAKKMMGLKPDDYLFVSVDLMSMTKDFNDGKNGRANSYEDSMNILHEIAKETNTHILGVFQPKRPSDKISIKTLEDTEKLKMSTEMLKNSGAIEERSRVIISVFRPYFTLKKYNPEAVELEYLEDVMEVNIIKQNNGDISPTLYYKFYAEKGMLIPYPDYDPKLAFNFDDEEDEDDD